MAISLYQWGDTTIQFELPDHYADLYNEIRTYIYERPKDWSLDDMPYHKVKIYERISNVIVDIAGFLNEGHMQYTHALRTVTLLKKVNIINVP